MSLNIKTTTRVDDAAEFIVSSVLRELNNSKKVLLFLTGGSSVAVGLKIAKLLAVKDLKNLTVTLTDERYVPVDNPNSNYFQLLQKGFTLPGAKVIPILTGDNLAVTTEKFNIALTQEFTKADYKIGLFGIGADGHTAGILPGSEAVTRAELAFGYETEKFSRITMTPRAIEKLDEAVVSVQGEDKWGTLRNLEEEIEIAEQPAQILKKVPLLTIFTDYQKKIKI